MEYLENFASFRVFQMIDSYLAVLFPAGLYWVLGGFLLGWLFLFLLKKIGLLKTGTALKKALNVIYCLLVPVVFAAIAFVYHANKVGGVFISQQIERSITPVAQLSFPLYQEYLQVNEQDITENNKSFEETVEDYTAYINYTPKNGKAITAFVANQTMPEMMGWGLTAIVKTAKKYPSDMDKTNMEIAKSFDETNYQQEFWKKVDKQIEVEADTFINSIQLKLLLFAICFLVLVVGVRLVLK